MTEHEATPEAWPMFLRDAANNRCAPGDGDTGAEPSLNWTYETDGDLWSSPVIADGTAYIGSYDEHLYAVSVDDGELQWRYRTGARIDGSPAVSDGTVYVGSHDRNIYALDAATGEERWIYGTRGIVRGSPTVTEDTVYIGAHCNYEVCVAYYSIRWPRTGYLYAFETDTGNLKWRFETSSEGVTTTPVVDSDLVYVAGGSTVHGLDPATGDPVWEYVLPRNRDFLASPVQVDGTLYVAGNTNGDVVALDAATGDPRWTYSADAVITGTPAICDDTLYVGSIESSGTLHAVSTADGEEQWTFKPNAEAIGSSPAVVGDIVYVGAHNLDGRIQNDAGLYGIDTSGEQRWFFEAIGDSNRGFGSSPAIVDGSLYIGGVDGHLYSFDL